MIHPRPRVLLLANEEGAGGKHTGYTMLGRYIEGGELIIERRREPRGFWQRLVVGVISRLACSRWYRWGSLRLDWLAWQRLRQDSADVVHVLWGDKDLGFIDVYAKLLDRPFCVSVHCCPDTLPAVFQKHGRLKEAAAIILMSEVQRPFFEACGVARERLHVVHHGVDCEFFKPAAAAVTVEKKEEAGVFTVLSVGNYRRNFERLKAVCLMLAKEPGIRFRVIAPLHWRPFFEGVPNVTLETGLSDDELRCAYQEASCLLMTVDAATANNALLEAMACGLPIVSEDVGGIAEYCSGVSAKMCEAGSVAALGEAVMQLREDPAAAGRMGLAARARAESLAWPKVAERMWPIYEQVLEEQRMISQ